MSADDLPLWHLDAVDGDAMGLWSELLRDDNPIHVDPAAAEALGYGSRTVNPGPINLAYALNMLLAARPGEIPVSIEARFLDNIFAGDAVEVTGKVDVSDSRSCRAEVRTGPDRKLALDVRVNLTLSDDKR